MFHNELSMKPYRDFFKRTIDILASCGALLVLVLAVPLAAMPVLLATDTCTDMGRIAECNGFGLWSLSGDLNSFMKHQNSLASDIDKTKAMGQKGKQFLMDNYTVDRIADIIIAPELC